MGFIKREKKTITYDSYLRFLGLATLMADHDRATKNIEHAAASLLKLAVEDEPDFYRTHAYDALHGNRDPRAALRLMGIEVEPEEKKTFEKGDVVRVRAAAGQPVGVPMAIENVCAMVPGKRIGVLCVWFDAKNELHREVFDPAQLERAAVVEIEGGGTLDPAGPMRVVEVDADA